MTTKYTSADSIVKFLPTAVLDTELAGLIAGNGYEWANDQRLLNSGIWPQSIALIGLREDSLTDVSPEDFLKARVYFADNSTGIISHLRRQSIFDASFKHEEYAYSHLGRDGVPVASVKAVRYGNRVMSLKLSYLPDEQEKTDEITSRTGVLRFFASPWLLCADYEDKIVNTVLTYRLAESAAAIHHCFGEIGKGVELNTDENLEYMELGGVPEFLQIRIMYFSHLTDKAKGKYRQLQ